MSSFFQRDDQTHNGSAIGAGRNLKLAVYVGEPFVHVFQAVAQGPGGDVTRAATVVLDPEDELSGFQPQPYARLGRLGVLDDVVDGFLESEENIVAHLG